MITRLGEFLPERERRAAEKRATLLLSARTLVVVVDKGNDLI